MSFKNIISALAMLFVVIAISSCSKSTDSKPDITNPGTTTAYLGQTPPGTTPVKFAPNSSYIATVGWWYQSAPAFSPDGKEMYFTKYFPGIQAHQIWYTKCVNDQWTTPAKAPFSTTSFDSSPKFSQSNDTLFFYSERTEGFIFKVSRTATGWSEPVPLNIPLPADTYGGQSFHVVKNGTVYFQIIHETGGTFMQDYATSDIYKSRLVNGQYTQPESLGSNVNSNSGESVDYVDPDERFIILSSLRPGGRGYHDLYISSKNQNGSWNSAINMGTAINSSQEDSSALITPDGKYLFYVTAKSGDNGYTPYWVDASIINGLL